MQTQYVDTWEFLVGSSQGSDEDKAGVTLREWLLRTGINKYASRVEAFRKTQRAIVAFNERKPIGKLYGVDTYFPWPLVDPVRR